MSFIKIGDSVPLKLENKCCECDAAAVCIHDNKLYCGKHLPDKEEKEDE